MSLNMQTERLAIHADPRGRLFKAWPRAHSGEVYVVEILPGTSRGHHFHIHGGEWFVPLLGHCTLIVEDPKNRQRAVVPLDGIRARVEAGHAHALFAQGTEPALVLAVADYNHEDEETVPHPIAGP